MTKEQIEKYIAQGGVNCPHCGGTDLDAKGVQVDAGQASQEVMCSECGQGWQDVYTLTHVEPY